MDLLGVDTGFVLLVDLVVPTQEMRSLFTRRTLGRLTVEGMHHLVSDDGIHTYGTPTPVPTSGINVHFRFVLASELDRT